MKTYTGRFAWIGYSLMLLSLMQVPHANAREVGGVELQEQVNVKGVDAPLQLNGAGIRSKFFFRIYVGALYLPQKQSSADKILQADEASRVLMHFLYDEVTREKLVNGWIEGLEANIDANELKALQSRVDQFNNLFETLHAGDVVLLDYVPGEGTRVIIGGTQRGVIEGADFHRALLSIWLGRSPVTGNLKDALLGLDD